MIRSDPAAPQLTHFGVFVLRTPLLPRSRWLTDDPTQRTQFIEDIVTKPDVREALYLGSESLSSEILQAIPHEWSPKLLRGVSKYVARMCTRSTPFGLFATISSGAIGSLESQFHLSPRSAITRRSRIDTLALDEFCVAQNADQDMRKALHYCVNDTAWRFGTRLHYVEVVRGAATGRQLRLAAADIDPYLEFVLDTDGRHKCHDLAVALSTRFAADDVEYEDALDYVNQLVDAQILRSTLWPVLTGPEAASELIDQLRAIGQDRVAGELAAVVGNLHDMDADGPGLEPARYGSLSATISPQTASNKFVQVDAYRPADAQLSEADVAEVADALTMLSRYSLRPFVNALLSFSKRFEERYGDREVPLLEVLDEDAGIGFESPEGSGFDHAPLLNGIPLAKPKPSATLDPARLTTLMRMVTAAEASGSGIVRLTAEDWRALSEDTAPQLPPTLAAMVMVERTPGLAPTMFLKTAGSTCGANMIARFCGVDPRIDDLVARVCQHDQELEPDVIVAEIVHSGGGREGNVVVRPVLRQYEIEFLGRSGAAAEYRIPPSDLLLSVTRGGPVLRSARLNRVVQPKLTSAHNVLRGIPIYRFLHALDSARVRTSLNWSWGPLLGMPFLPRVMWNRVVLSRAQWTISKGAFGDRESDEPVAAWRNARRVPRWIALFDGDNELPLDLEQSTDRDILRRAVKQAETAVVELFPVPGCEIGQSAEGAHSGEFLIPFRTTVRPVRRRHHGGAGSQRRPFGPASPWRYTKIYAGPSQIDRVLKHDVSGIVRGLTESGALDKWFFIRYFDPDGHLRLRFQAASEGTRPLLAAQVDEWLDRLLVEKKCWKVQVDSYDREVERYGGPGRIEIAEEFFHADSELVTALLEHDLAAEERWFAGLLSVDHLLDSFGLTIAQRQALMTSASSGLSSEYAAGKPTRIALGQRFRGERPRIARALKADSDDELAVRLRPVFASGDRHLRAIAARLVPADSAGALASRDGELILSLVHMRLNRLLLSSHRPQEMILYDWLARSYESMQHRRS